MNPAMQTRRRFPRLNSHNPALVKKIAPDALEGFARTSVLGLGGCALASDEAFGSGQGVELLISLRGHVITAYGRVVYEKDRGDGLKDMGVEFLWLSEEDLGVLRALFGAAASVFPEV